MTDQSPEVFLKRHKTHKNLIIFVGLPLAATFIMSTAIIFSRMRISSYTRIYGTRQHKAGESAAFRVTMYRRKFRDPISPISVEAWVISDGKRIPVYKGHSSKGDEALSVNLRIPDLPVGSYTMYWQITNEEYGEDHLRTPLEVVELPDPPRRIYNDKAGENPGNLESAEVTPLRPDSDGIAVALHPVNARGLRSPFQDILYLVAVTDDGSPVSSLEARMKITKGKLGIPKNSQCATTPTPECLDVYGPEDTIPVPMKTNSLGLDYMLYYPRSDIINIELGYRTDPKKAFKIKTIELGSTRDDVAFMTSSRIVSSDLPVSLFAYTTRPLYIDIYQQGRWLYTLRAPVHREKTSFILTERILRNGFYKIQASVFYLPVANSIFSLTVHPGASPEDIGVLEKAVKAAKEYASIGPLYRKHLEWILAHRALWRKYRYNVVEVAPYFFGMLDTFHYEPDIRASTRARRQKAMMYIRTRGQAAMILVMQLSGIILVLMILLGTYTAIRERRKSQEKIREILKSSDISGDYVLGDNNRSSTQLIALGIIMAIIVGLMVTGLIWLMLHLKWEM